MKQIRKYDIFISYRREGGFETANLIASKLKMSGYKVFLDIHSMHSGDFSEQLKEKVKECKDFIWVLSPTIVKNNDGTITKIDTLSFRDGIDYFRDEICWAIEYHKNIIPVILDGFIFPEESEASESPETQGPVVPTVNNGEYYAIAFSDDAGFYKFSSYEEFAEDVSLSMTELYAEVPGIPDEEVSQDKNFIDFNAYAGFIKHTDEPLYLDIIKAVTFPSSQHTINITPKNLTRSLTFKLLSRSEAGVTVEGISAVLSGAVTKVQLMSGLMTKSNTGKLAFELTKRGTESKIEKGETVVYDVYEGKVNLLGLFSSEDKAYITGPGIFQVAVTASVTDNGKQKQRVFHAGLNLKPILDKLELMVLSDDKTGYTMKEQSQISMIEITTPLHVMKNQILASDTEGLVQWQENDVEIMPEEMPDVVE